MFEELKAILIDEIQIKEELIKPEAELIQDLGMNSIELSELVLACEEKYGIEVEEEIAKNFVTVQDIVDYMEKKAG